MPEVINRALFPTQTRRPTRQPRRSSELTMSVRPQNSNGSVWKLGGVQSEPADPIGPLMLVILESGKPSFRSGGRAVRRWLIFMMGITSAQPATERWLYPTLPSSKAPS
jgi:hypothetical protein